MTTEDFINLRMHFKRMLIMAKSLPESAARNNAIAELEVKILLIKLHLNCVY